MSLGPESATTVALRVGSALPFRGMIVGRQLGHNVQRGALSLTIHVRDQQRGARRKVMEEGPNGDVLPTGIGARRDVTCQGWE